MKMPNAKNDDQPGIILDKIIAEIARLLKQPQEAVDAELSFLDLGIDSILGVDLVEALNKVFTIELGPEIVYDYLGPIQLAGHIAQEHGERLAASNAEDESEEQLETPPAEDKKEEPAACDAAGDIAIIGISGRFAGSANLEEYWRHLEQGDCCIKEIKREGWHERDYYDPDPAKAGKSISKWGGLLDDIDAFDPLFFHISPREAERMDPQQRIFLEESYKAFEDSGCAVESLSGKKVGVFVGARGMDYKEQSLLEEEINTQTLLGNDMSILAARVSYYLNLKGPNLTIDTACSSSLTAIHLACESLHRGESELALAGGVFIMPSPQFYIMASKAGMLSPGPHCKTFDDSADGMVVGEGVGAVVLKPLAAALKDNDHIHALIKASAVNHNGRTQGITAPSTIPQKEIICQAFKKAHINPETVGYIEAQGTGTHLGDHIEVKALVEGFRAFTAKEKFCAIGSHSPNIGHSMAAAGMAGLFKILLAIKYQKIPPLVGPNKINHNIHLQNSPFYIPTTPQQWHNKSGRPLRAGIGTFAYNGGNCYLIIEAPPAAQASSMVNGQNASPGNGAKPGTAVENKNAAAANKPYYFIPLSAKSEESLQCRIRDLSGWLENNAEKWSPGDIAYTLQVGRTHFHCRCALIVTGISDLQEKLHELINNKTPDNYFIAIRQEHEKIPHDHLAMEIAKKLINELQELPYTNESHYKEQLISLAELYTGGTEIHWGTLYGGRPGNYQRIPLPAYPFKKQRCWVPKENSAQYSRCTRMAGSQSRFMPFTPLSSRQHTQHTQHTLQTQPGQYTTRQKPSNEKLSEAIKNKIVEKVIIALGVNKNDINLAKQFSEYGVDSHIGVELIEAINKEFNIALRATSLFDYGNVEKLAAYILSEYGPGLSKTLTGSPMSTGLPGQDGPDSMAGMAGMRGRDYLNPPDTAANIQGTGFVGNPGSIDIAVIGISCRFAGAGNAEEYWQNLEKGKCTITEVPSDRWDAAIFYDPDNSRLDRTNCKWGGFLEAIDMFDPLFFNISGKEAQMADPQQRIFLEACWHALEDAGYAGESLAGTNCGVFAGTIGGDYQAKTEEQNYPLDAQSAVGNFDSILGTRISYFLDLKGPNMTIDTSCSSSLAAIHLGCQSILAGESNMVIAGGVFIAVTPRFYILNSNMGALSPDGVCRTFDNDANGFVPGEGVGVVILKPLAEALKDGDHIYGIIKSSGINQDGKTNGITAPSSISQSTLELSVYEKAGIDPGTITYVEAHGTGTKLGDPIEVDALTTAFRKYTDKKQYCGIGSVKTNIGHTISAAGVAGVIKVLMALKYKKLPPSLNLNKENEFINFKDSPFYVNTTLKEWHTGGDYPRRAVVSAFGFSGTNCHLLIEEANPAEAALSRQAKEEEGNPAAKSWYLIPLSAKTGKSLQGRIKDLAAWTAKEAKHHNLTDICCTLQNGRSHFPIRAALIVKDAADLERKLTDICQKGTAEDYLVLLPGEPKLKQDSLIKEFGKQLTAQLQNPGQFDNESYKEKLSALAGLYVQGCEIDWQIFYPEEGYQRISLPVYSFDRESYWLTGNGEGEGQETIPGEKSSLAYFRTVWAEAGPTGANHNLNDLTGPILLFDSSEDLWHALKEKSILVNLVIPGKQYRFNGSNKYEIVPGNKEDYSRLIESLKERDLLPGKIIHKWAYAGSGFAAPDADEEKTAAFHLARSIYSLFYLSKALMEQKTFHPIHLLYIYPAHENIASSYDAAIDGFARSLVQENPAYIYKTIEMEEPGNIPGLLEILAAEFAPPHAGTNEQFQVRYANGKRWCKRLEEIETLPKDESHENIPLKENGVYLITGGIGELGLLLAGYLARRVKARLVLTDRSALSPRKKQHLEELEKTGAGVYYIRCDVADKTGVEKLAAEIKERFGNLDGIFHCAGVTRDAFLLKKDTEQVSDVLGPKVLGTLWLESIIRKENTGFLVLFSSVAAVFGNIGQCDYAYANSFMDRCATVISKQNKDTAKNIMLLSINWPLWENGGMQMTGDQRMDWLQRTGTGILPSSEGLKALAVSFALDSPGCIVTYSGSRHRELINRCFNRPGFIPAPQSGESAQAAPVSSNTPSGISQAQLRDRTREFLKEIFAEVLNLPAAKIDPGTAFKEYGVDSLIIHRFNTRMARQLENLPRTLLFEYQTLHELTEYLCTHHEAALMTLFRQHIQELETPVINPGRQTAVPKTMPDIKRTPGPGSGYRHLDKYTVFKAKAVEEADPGDEIAIIGVSGRYPQARNIAEFWENLKNGRDCITEIPPDRWDYRNYYHPDPDLAASGKAYCKWGGFLENVDRFDPLFFNIAPREAEVMDPQERIFLESAWSVLEDAGYTRKVLQDINKDKKGHVGIFAGVTTYTYLLWGPDLWRKGSAVMPNSLPWSLANRVSYVFNFHGPSMPVDTACASALTAVHLACESLKRGECDMAIAGGVNLYLHPSRYVWLCQTRALSFTGRCHTFGAGGDGFVPGEGAGALLLKPLRAAVRDRDHIYAVIKGSSINHGGTTNGYTVPNPNAQSWLILDALKKARIDAGSIGYIEAHGTGTILGDPIEIAGLTSAFREFTPAKQFCPIGSVKTNIGHLESAAGVAGLTKILLQMKYKQLAPSLHANELNPNIDFENSPFYVQQKLTNWEQPSRIERGAVKKYPRRAGISSFGAGGANAHVIIEEYEKPAPLSFTVPLSIQEQSFVIILSARNEERLKAYAREMLQYLDKIERTGGDHSQTIPDKVGEYITGNLQHDLIKIAAVIISIDPKEFKPEEHLQEQGFDPVSLVNLIDRINETYGLDITPAIFPGITTLKDLAEYLYREFAGKLASHYPMPTPKITHEEKKDTPPDLADIAYTLQVGREPMDVRLAAVVSSIAELKDKLTNFCQPGESENIENLYLDNTGHKKLQHESLLEGEDGQEIIKNIIKNKKFSKLAWLWVTGVDIDWNLLYTNHEPGQYPRRIPLPAYPFSGKRCWFAEKSGATVKDAPGNLHPLLDRLALDRSLIQGGIIYEKIWTQGDIIIKDHQVDGRTILPGVGFLEIALAAAGSINSTYKKLVNVAWMQPLEILPGEAQKNSHIQLSHDKNENTGDQLKFEIKSGCAEDIIVHARGEIHGQPHMAHTDMGRRLTLDIEDIKARCTQHIDKETIYTAFKNMGLVYGPYFRGLVEIWGNQNESLGYLNLPPLYEKELAGYTLHPALADSALQSIIGISFHPGLLNGKPTVPMVPFTIREVEIFSPLASRCYSYARTTARDLFDISILDENGRECIKFHEVSFRKFKKSAPGYDFYYIPVWKRIPASSVPTGTGEQGKRAVIIVHAGHGILFKEALANAHQAAGDNVYEVKIQDAGFDGLANAFAPGQSSFLIYFLGGMQDDNPGPGDTGVLDALAQSQERGVIALFRLVKELSRRGFTWQPLHLKVITNDVHPVTTGQTIRPYGASLHGFIKTMAQEYPRWETGCIDIGLDEQKNGSIAAQVEQVLSGPFYSQGRDVAIREGRKYLQFLQPLQLPAPDPLPFKQGGVYFILGGAGGIGLELAEFLARTVKAAVVLAGRTPQSQLKPTQAEKIKQINSSGGHALYLQADAANLDSMKAAVREAKSRFGKINGVIHSAIVLKDKTLENMDEESFRAALAPKVKGSAILAEIFRQEPLDFMMFFSAAQVFGGNPGQANYTAACAFKDAFALYLQQIMPFPIKIIDWGYWGSVGIAATEAFHKRMAGRGIYSIESHEGMQAIQLIMDKRLTRLVPFKGDMAMLERMGVDFDQPQVFSPAISHTDRECLQPAGTGCAPANLRERTLEYVREVFARILKTDKEELDTRSTFERFGVDSLVVLDINKEFNKNFEKLPPSLLFEFTTIEALAGYFSSKHPETMEKITGSAAPVQASVSSQAYTINEGKEIYRVPAESPGFSPPGSVRSVSSVKMPGNNLPNSNSSQDIAIIGAAGRYPLAPNLDIYWRNLKDGRDCISEIPGDRWDWRKEEGKSCSRWGGFIENVDKFDSLFFNISPAEAEGMDPQERLFMEITWTLLEDAGITRKTLAEIDHKVGVFVGVMSRDYDRLGAAEIAGTGGTGGPGVTNAHSYYWSIANRVSYYFDLQGPSLAVDTACSASLTAVHLACESINNGECRAAIAGGVNLILHPSHYRELTMAKMITGGAECRSFAAGADGFVVGEGTGAILLKPLHSALNDNDRIYAVIKGSSINAGGKTAGYMSPNPHAQAELVSEALKKAGINPRTISYIEAQAVGSAVGDSAEITGLIKAFSQYTTDKQFCAIGSVKSNIGHLESASGIAGLTKVILQMKHKQFVPSLHAEPLNPGIDFENSPFYVQRDTAEWKQPVIIRDGNAETYPRRAGISSFGAGGANAHLILEEWPESTSHPIPDLKNEEQEELILLSAKNAERLKVYAGQMIAFLENTTHSIQDIAYTLQTGREAMDERYALVVSSTGQLKNKLNRYLRGDENIENSYAGNAKKNRRTLGIREIEIKAGEEQDFKRLAQLWVEGADIDWKQLYPFHRHYRLQVPLLRAALPTYPFAGPRAWLNSTAASVGNACRGGLQLQIPGPGKTHFTVPLTGKEFFLVDHVIAGRKTLPGVVYIEMARAAAEIYGQKMVAEIKNITWNKPIIPENNPCDVHINLYHTPGENTLDFEISTGDREDQRNIHARGKLVLQIEPQKNITAESIGIKALQQRCLRSWTGNECYSLFQKTGFHYGCSFQTIQSLCSSAGEAISLLRLPADQSPGFADFSDSGMHPSLMDGALQTVIGLLDIPAEKEKTIDPYVPLALEKMEIIRPLPLPVECYVYVVPSDSEINRGKVPQIPPGPAVMKKFNILIIDENGQSLVKMKNVIFKKIEPVSPVSSVSSVSSSRNETTVEEEIEKILKHLQSGEMDEAEADHLLQKVSQD